MDQENTTLTVYFEDPFWVGLFEKVWQGKLSVCKVTFGAEPKEYEVLEYLLKNYGRLKFSPTVEITVKNCKINPKRMQRIARKQTLEKGLEQSHNRLCSYREKKANKSGKKKAENKKRQKNSVCLT